jgi:ferredoxin
MSIHGMRRQEKTYRIEIDREGCIACASCYTMDPEHFESDADGKSRVVGGTSNGRSTGGFNDSKVVEAEAAASSCPVSVIKVTESPARHVEAIKSN